MIASREDEVEVEVRFADQQNINEFGRLNNRLQEISDDRDKLRTEMAGLDDANTDLMMGVDGCRLLIGETYVECSEEYATEYVERLQERTQGAIDEFDAEEESIRARQEELKKELYGRFGTSINLEL
mmetsp:Transcript_21397/g.42731  ORF Transcript_21397/g.42731 Transcript_21397/m.42731 type:complete len:127 (+) Transcript_21397:20-400(+)